MLKDWIELSKLTTCNIDNIMNIKTLQRTYKSFNFEHNLILKGDFTVLPGILSYYEVKFINFLMKIVINNHSYFD